MRIASLAVSLSNCSATERLASHLRQKISNGFTLYLSGELGCGKTFFTRALLRSFGYLGKVRSPTFTLMEHYPLSSLTLLHFDFYRLASPQDWLDLGFDSFFDGKNVVVIEWPERAEACTSAGMHWKSLPAPDLHIIFGSAPACSHYAHHSHFPGASSFEEEHASGAPRTAEIRAYTTAGAACLSNLERPISL